MDRRHFLGSLCLATVMMQAGCASTTLRSSPSSSSRTRWLVRGSEGYDALSFLAPLSGDPFYLNYYRDAVAAFAPRMPAAAMATLRAMTAQARQAGVLLSPFLDLRFSGGPDSTIDDLIGSLDNAETVLRPAYQASSYWAGEAGWAPFIAGRAPLRAVLAAMRDAGFADFRAALFEPKAARRFPQLRERLGRQDVIAEIEHVTGRSFDPQIEVILLEFCKPHGVKVIGQRFLSAIDWGDETVLRTAGHELLHPPVAPGGPAAAAALAVLGQDPLLARILREHDPVFGYNRLDGLFDEDLTSALDQLVGERLSVARVPGERWNDVDGGMHVLAAALYGMLVSDGWRERGGNIETWLAQAAASGRLAPASIATSAATVLGRPADRLWPAPARP